MARASTKRSQCASAMAGVSLGLDEPAPRPQVQSCTVEGPARAQAQPAPPASTERAEPAVRPKAVLLVSAKGKDWMVRGDVPGFDPFLLQGNEPMELSHAPWVAAVIRALREVTYRHFYGAVEIRITESLVVGFLRVTIPDRDRAGKWLREDEPKPPAMQRLYREFLMLYLQVEPSILWVWN